MKLRLILIGVLLFLIAGCSSKESIEEVTRVLIVVGPSNHKPGTHEVAAGGRLMAYCLENMENVPGFKADVVYAWSEIPKPLDAYSSTVFIGDNFPGELLEGSHQAMDDIAGMMARGCGILCVHYGVGLQNEHMGLDGDHPLLHWMGGFFAAKCDHHQSIARHYDASIEAPNSSHPTARGWDTFTLREEPYINIYFGPEDNQMLKGAFPLATSMLPPEEPKNETIAWGIERSDTGRGAGITMPHFYKNWLNEDLRRFILNTVVWSTKREVPSEGVKTTLPDLETFQPESVEFVPTKK